MTPRVGGGGASRIVLIAAAAVVVVIGLHLGRELITPVLLALVLVITVHPVRGALLARGAPPWAATGAVITVAWLVLLTIIGLTVAAGGLFVAVANDYQSDFDAAKHAVNAFAEQLGYAASGNPISSWLDPDALIAAAAQLTVFVTGSIVAFAFVLTYVLFMTVDAPRLDALRTRFEHTHRRLFDAFTGYAGSVRSYFVVNTIFGVSVAVLDGLLLWAAGVPAPLAWAVLAFVTNYIPNIGFVIGLIPAVVLAFVTGGWPTGLIVLIGYCAINITLQTFIQPKFVSTAVRLTLTLTFFSVIFWTVVLGPIGAILAIPMTLLARTILLDVPAPTGPLARWITGDTRDDLPKKHQENEDEL